LIRRDAEIVDDGLPFREAFGVRHVIVSLSPRAAAAAIGFACLLALHSMHSHFVGFMRFWHILAVASVLSFRAR